MTEKRFKVKQNDTLYFVTDTVENKLLWTFEFKENEFASLACFIGLIDKLNELAEENAKLKNELNSFSPVIFNDVIKGTVILYDKKVSGME